MIPITQVNQNALKCLAALIAVEVQEAVKDPEWMKRFEEWKKEREYRHEHQENKVVCEAGD